MGASKALRNCAKEIIKSDGKQKDMNKTESGHVLLTKGNASLEQTLGKLGELE